MQQSKNGNVVAELVELLAMLLILVLRGLRRGVNALHNVVAAMHRAPNTAPDVSVQREHAGPMQAARATESQSGPQGPLELGPAPIVFATSRDFSNYQPSIPRSIRFPGI